MVRPTVLSVLYPKELVTWDTQEEEKQNMGNRAKTRSLLQLVSEN
jgi:hypothetical protein